MRVLVTGASGFLGSWVAQRLSEEGYEVRALVRANSNRTFLQTLSNLEFALGSVEEPDRLAAAVEGAQAVIHCAGLVKAKNEAEFIRTNVDGTRNVVAASRKRPIKRLVVVSSLEAAGPSSDGQPVGAQENPITSYGRSKLAAEKAALEAKDDVPVTILRPGAIYGPRDQEIFELFRTISRGLRPTVAGGQQKGSFIYARDCADACIRAIDADVPSGSTYFVDDNEPVSNVELFEHVERALGKRAFLRLNLPAGVLRAVSHGIWAYGRVTNRAVMLTPEKANMLLQHWVGGSHQTQAALDWKPQTRLGDGISHAARWYRDNGWL